MPKRLAILVSLLVVVSVAALSYLLHNRPSASFGIGPPTQSSLAAENITIPATATVGETISIGFTIRNLSQTSASNNPFSSVYLSNQETWDGTASLLGTVWIGSLMPGASQHTSLQISVPPLKPGSYYLYVQPDVYHPTPERAVRSEALKISINELPIGTPLQKTYTQDEVDYYQVTLPTEADTLISVSPFSANLEVGYRTAALPTTLSETPSRLFTPLGTRETGQLRFPASATPQTVYLKIHNFVGTNELKIEASPRTFELGHFQPTRGSIKGQTTMKLAGAEFSQVSGARLVRRAGSQGCNQTTNAQTERLAKTIFHQTSISLFAVFDLTNLCLGDYDVLLKNGNKEVTSPTPFTVTDGPQGHLELSLTAPSKLRAQRAGTVRVNYTNTGETDVISPFITLSATTNPGKVSWLPQAKAEADDQLSPDVLFDPMNFSFDSFPNTVPESLPASIDPTIGQDGILQVPALNPDGPSVLPPGSSGSFSARTQANIQGNTVHFKASSSNIDINNPTSLPLAINQPSPRDEDEEEEKAMENAMFGRAVSQGEYDHAITYLKTQGIDTSRIQGIYSDGNHYNVIQTSVSDNIMKVTQINLGGLVIHDDQGNDLGQEFTGYTRTVITETDGSTRTEISTDSGLKFTIVNQGTDSFTITGTKNGKTETLQVTYHDDGTLSYDHTIDGVVIHDSKESSTAFEKFLQEEVKREFPSRLTTKTADSRVVASNDPNDLIGPSGFGDQHWLAQNQALNYMIEFENKPTASAPAQTVTISEPIDPNLDLATLQLTSLTVGSQQFPIPTGLRSYRTRLDLRAIRNLYVDVDIHPDLASRNLVWSFISLDPVTLQPTQDPLAGFLPPDDATAGGQGSVSYSIQPLTTVANGATIQAQASVVFDTNQPILTPNATNRIDTDVPTASIASSGTSVVSQTIPLTLTGTDQGSGIVGYRIYQSTDNGPLRFLKSQTDGTDLSVTGLDGHRYGFAVQTIDGVGHQSPIPETAQSTIAVTLPAAQQTNQQVAISSPPTSPAPVASASPTALPTVTPKLSSSSSPSPISSVTPSPTTILLPSPTAAASNISTAVSPGDHLTIQANDLAQQSVTATLTGPNQSTQTLPTIQGTTGLSVTVPSNLPAGLYQLKLTATGAPRPLATYPLEVKGVRDTQQIGVVIAGLLALIGLDILGSYLLRRRPLKRVRN